MFFPACERKLPCSTPGTRLQEASGVHGIGNHVQGSYEGGISAKRGQNFRLPELQVFYNTVYVMMVKEQKTSDTAGSSGGGSYMDESHLPQHIHYCGRLREVM